VNEDEAAVPTDTVPEGFRYASNNNEERLNGDGLRKLLAEPR